MGRLKFEAAITTHGGNPLDTRTMIGYLSIRCRCCESGGTGRRAGFRFQWWQHCGGSNPPFRNTEAPRYRGAFFYGRWTGNAPFVFLSKVQAVPLPGLLKGRSNPPFRNNCEQVHLAVPGALVHICRWSEAESNTEAPRYRGAFFYGRWTGNAPFAPTSVGAFFMGGELATPPSSCLNQSGRSRWTNYLAGAAFTTRRKMVIVGFLSNGSP